MKKALQFIRVVILFIFSLILIPQSLAQGAGSALDFESSSLTGADGQFVVLGSHPSIQITGDLTIEFWFRLETIGRVQQLLIMTGPVNSEAEVDNTLYSIALNATNHIEVQHESGAGPNSTLVSSVATFAIATWYHVAITRDVLNDLYQIYINGIAEIPVSYGTSLDPSGGSAGTALLGILNFPGTGLVRDFDGIFDEVRIWNAERSQAEIRDNMNKVLSGSESNLVAYWRMDDGSGQTVADYQSSGNNDGTLGATSGSGTDDPAWIVSSAPVGENSALVITTDPTSVGPVGGNVTITITSTPDASNNLMVYQFGSVSGAPVTAGETFPIGFDRRSDVVWGVNEIGAVTANLVFDYSNQVGIDDPSMVEILVRDDANDATWEEVTEAGRDDGARTITLTGISDFSEFAIGGSLADNPLPVDLITFTAIGKNGSVLLTWETNSEIENQGFEIRRSTSDDGVYDLITSYDTNVELESRGNSSRGYKYSYIDNSILPNQKYYYKLIDVSYNGYRTGHGPVLAIFSEANLEQVADVKLAGNFILLQNYPNPFNPETTIEFALPENLFTEPQFVSLSIFNLQGKLVRNLLHSVVGSGQYKIFWNGSDENSVELASGIYIYQLQVPALNISQSRRMMFLK